MTAEIGLIIWVVGIVVCTGIVYELDLNHDKNDVAERVGPAVIIGILWPVVPVLAAAGGALYAGAFLGRGPVMLVRHIMRRRKTAKLPTAIVIAKESA